MESSQHHRKTLIICHKAIYILHTFFSISFRSVTFLAGNTQKNKNKSNGTGTGTEAKGKKIVQEPNGNTDLSAHQRFNDLLNEKPERWRVKKFQEIHTLSPSIRKAFGVWTLIVS